MRRQGAWMNWTGVTECSVTWNDIWKASPYSLKFLLSSVYDLPPTPVNFQLWGKREDAACGLCGRRASLEHILSSCKTALTQGRYRWRLDQVLKELAQCLEERMKKVKTTGGTTFIQFVKPSREATKAEKQRELGLLASAGDWEMFVDLERQLRFPREIRSTELRPDIVIWSRRSKQVIIVADRSMGRQSGAGIRAEVCKIPGSTFRVCGGRLEMLEFSCEGQRQRVPSAFIVEDDVHAGTERCAEEESRSESFGGSRKRFKLAVATEQR